MGKKGDPAWYNLDREVPAGSNTKVMNCNIALASLPKIDINDPDQVGARIIEYLDIYSEFDMAPTIAGLAIALGISRQELWSINTQKFYTIGGRSTKLPKTVIDQIRKAYSLLDNVAEMRLINGKVNPAAGIFHMKNHFGYRDVVEQQVQQETKTVQYSIDDIRKHYLPNDSNSRISTLAEGYDSSEVSTFDSH